MLFHWELGLPSSSCCHSGSWSLTSVLKQFWLTGIFSFTTVIVSSHCFLASILSDEKSADSVIEEPFCAMICFFLLSHFSFYLAFDILIVSQSGLSEFILLGVCWTSWMCRLIFFIQFRGVWAIISSNTFFFRFLDSVMHMLVWLIVFHIALKLIFFFLSLFSRLLNLLICLLVCWFFLTACIFCWTTPVNLFILAID